MIVLDTHALVWWASDPGQIPARARRRIKNAVESGSGIAASSISVWEIAMLVSRSRLRLTLPVDLWLASLAALPHLQFIPVGNQVVIRAAGMDDCPSRDPADRMIVATAILLGAPLITGDRRLRSFDALTTVWN